MPRTIQTLAFKYDELSDTAKAKARGWLRDARAEDNFYAGFILEEFEKITAFCGWTIEQQSYHIEGGEKLYKPAIYWSGFWNQGDGACFAGHWDASKVDAGGLRKHAPKDKELHSIAREFSKLKKSAPGSSARVWHIGHYCNEHSVTFDCVFPDGPLPSLTIALSEASRRLMRWLYEKLKAEYEYQDADEQVADDIIANEYEFTVKGERL